MNRFVSRRLVLRGAAGVALTLPWLESLLPTKSAQAQAVAAPKRFLPIFIPNGASENWKPLQVGVGAAWTMSPVFELFGAALKAKMNVFEPLAPVPAASNADWPKANTSAPTAPTR